MHLLNTLNQFSRSFVIPARIACSNHNVTNFRHLIFTPLSTISILIGLPSALLFQDPEDDDNPPKPGIFLQNVFMGSLQGMRRAGDGQDDGDEAGMAAMPAPGGSDVFGFIKGLIKAVVGGITSIVTNTLAGLSSGASKGSGELAMGASGASSTGSDGVAAMLAG